MILHSEKVMLMPRFYSRHSHAGFTLLEMMVVVVLLALTMTLIPPLFSTGVSSAELKSAARELVAGLRQVRGRAIAKQEETIFLMDVDQRSYRLKEEGRFSSLPSALDIRLTTGHTEVRDDKLGGIRFFPDGSSTGGQIQLSNHQREYRVDVEWLTGKVTLSE